MFSTARVCVLGLALALAASSLTACGAPAAYPSRPLTMVVPWGAGGGTDAVARTIASLMEQDLGQPINVVNRTGGSGVVGHQAIADAAPDGYTFGIITTEIAMLRHQGLTTLTGAAYTPLGMVNYDPVTIEVRADAPWTTLPAMVDDIRRNPGKFKASGTAQGGIWHVAMHGFLHEQGIPPAAVPWVPSASAAAGLLDLLAGGVDIAPVSHPEARSLMDSGKVKSLAIFDSSRSTLYPNVPTAEEAMGSKWQMGVWRGFGAPKGLPDAIRVRLEQALKKAYDSQAYRDFSTNRGFGLRWADPATFAAFMAEADTQMGEVMRSIGLAK